MPSKSGIYMTVGDLRKALEGVSDDALVYYQRIEDLLFDEHGWAGDMMRFQDDGDSEYLQAFSAYLHPDSGDFVLNAHY